MIKNYLKIYNISYDEFVDIVKNNRADIRINNIAPVYLAKNGAMSCFSAAVLVFLSFCFLLGGGISVIWIPWYYAPIGIILSVLSFKYSKKILRNTAWKNLLGYGTWNTEMASTMYEIMIKNDLLFSTDANIDEYFTRKKYEDLYYEDNCDSDEDIVSENKINMYIDILLKEIGLQEIYDLKQIKDEITYECVNGIVLFNEATLFSDMEQKDAEFVINTYVNEYLYDEILNEEIYIQNGELTDKGICHYSLWLHTLKNIHEHQNNNSEETARCIENFKNEISNCT